MKRLDPRTRLAVGFLAIAAVVATRRSSTVVAELIAVVGILPLLGLIRPWISSLKFMLPVTVLVFLVGTISFSLGEALFLSIRLVNLLTLSFVVFQKVTVKEIGESARKIGLPYGFSFILTSSMRYVPLLGDRLAGIMDAQRSRGIDLRPRLRNIPNFLALAVPLLVQSFVLSEQLAMAMEARGFSIKGRTFRKLMRLGPVDWILMALSTGLFALFVSWEVLGSGG
ncbi:MAG: energy-coupling factor transporter transmembrane protein EcfT [Desulfobacteraceae bacterium]|nr:MAG: energy-coupling factor transporter transmembrane protein EcfT [Desulfobacteraceae bacterium]